MTFRRKIDPTLFALILAMTCWSQPAWALEMGDPAPALKIAQWVKGQAVDLTAAKGKQVVVLEFWATWCGPCRMSMPHLTELQKKYADKGLVIIGVSDESPSLITRFVDQMGKEIGYTIAADQRLATSRAYMGGVGAQGIPYTFVIDKQGRLAWHGHPGQGLEAVLIQVLEGTYDIEEAKALEAAKKVLIGYFTNTLQAEVATDTEQRTRLREKAKGQADELLKRGQKHPAILDMLAWNIITLPELKTRDFDLALRAAQKAFELSKEKNPAFADTYARALWVTDQKAKAVEYEKKAIALASHPQMKEAFQKVLGEYEKELEGQKAEKSSPTSQPSVSQ